MNKVNKVNFIISELDNLFPEVPIPLNHKDPYTLLIAVLLSAQCTDERVNQITPGLFRRADNPYDMMKKLNRFIAKSRKSIKTKNKHNTLWRDELYNKYRVHPIPSYPALSREDTTSWNAADQRHSSIVTSASKWREAWN